jgi:hypothetical protein
MQWNGESLRETFLEGRTGREGKRALRILSNSIALTSIFAIRGNKESKTSVKSVDKEGRAYGCVFLEHTRQDGGKSRT